jgi:hypothetical protein
MIRILKNKTAEDAYINYGNTTVVVEAGNQRDLAETFLAWQLAAIDDLALMLGQGTDKFQLNDGVSDLEAIRAIDLIRSYVPAIQSVSLSGVPTDLDGKPQMVPNLLPGWTSLYFTGQGDHRVNGVGKGTSFTCASDTSGDSTIEWIYTDQIFLVGGMALFSGGELGDVLDYFVAAPATPTGTGTTAVTKAPYGPGNVLLPNPAGSDVIDLADCAIVPTAGAGFWDWDAPTQGLGTITPNYAGTGGYSLFDFEVPLGHPLVGLHILGSGKLDFLMSNITPMKVLPHWLHRAVVHNSGHTGLKMAWMFVGGRGGAI